MKLEGIATFLMVAESGALGEAARRLRVVDIGIEAEQAYVYIAHAAGRHPPAKLRALAAWLGDAFGDPLYCELGRKRGRERMRAHDRGGASRCMRVSMQASRHKPATAAMMRSRPHIAWP